MQQLNYFEIAYNTTSHDAPCAPMLESDTCIFVLLLMQADTGVQQEQRLGAPDEQGRYFGGRATRMVLKRPSAAPVAAAPIAPPPPKFGLACMRPPPPPEPGGYPPAPGPPMDVE